MVGESMTVMNCTFVTNNLFLRVRSKCIAEVMNARNTHLCSLRERFMNHELQVYRDDIITSHSCSLILSWLALYTTLYMYTCVLYERPNTGSSSCGSVHLFLELL